MQGFGQGLVVQVLAKFSKIETENKHDHPKESW